MKKILVADDEEGIRILYKEELERKDMKWKLLPMAKKHLNYWTPSFLILLFGYQDARYECLDILQRIRTMFRDLPVILSSAYPEYQQNLATWASDAYVVNHLISRILRQRWKKFRRVMQCWWSRKKSKIAGFVMLTVR